MTFPGASKEPPGRKGSPGGAPRAGWAGSGRECWPSGPRQRGPVGDGGPAPPGDAATRRSVSGWPEGRGGRGPDGRDLQDLRHPAPGAGRREPVAPHVLLLLHRHLLHGGLRRRHPQDLAVPAAGGRHDLRGPRGAPAAGEPRAPSGPAGAPPPLSGPPPPPRYGGVCQLARPAAISASAGGGILAMGRRGSSGAMGRLPPGPGAGGAHRVSWGWESGSPSLCGGSC